MFNFVIVTILTEEFQTPYPRPTLLPFQRATATSAAAVAGVSEVT
jgi:hypothetical protein